MVRGVGRASLHLLDDVEPVAVGIVDGVHRRHAVPADDVADGDAASRMAACSASASGTVNRMPVSVPASGRVVVVALSAIEVAAPGGATSIQRMVGLIGASSRFSKPRVST